MTEPIKLRIGDRTIWIVRPHDVERWEGEIAAGVLRDAADEWPVRDALLRLSDALHGPEHVGPAVAFLADALERGTLVAVRMPDEAAGLAGLGAGADGWDDVRRLSDLREDPPATRKDGPGGQSPRDPPRRVVPDPWVPGRGDDVVDPNASFVAFAVFDQHGKRMRGRSECTVDASRHAHALAGATIEIRPVGAHARIELTLVELAVGAA